MQVKDLGEFGLIERIASVIAADSQKVVLGMGDDTAVLPSSGGFILITTDTFVEGVHFKRDFISFHDLGWRLACANLSDIAAMGGLPDSAVINLTIPTDLEVKSVEELYTGIAELTREFGAEIVGGDTTVSLDRIVLTMTFLGHVEKDRIALRSGAKVGDAVLVTGALGGAKVGLEVLKANEYDRFSRAVEKYRRPVPRLRESRFLVEKFSVRAMIDISDGLASEAGHICRRSSVGMELEAKAIPLLPDVDEAAQRSGEAALNYALSGGEDFELLFTVPAGEAEQLKKQFFSVFNYPCTRIGTVIQAEKGLLLRNKDGESEPLTQSGYDHFK